MSLINNLISQIPSMINIADKGCVFVVRDKTGKVIYVSDSTYERSFKEGFDKIYINYNSSETIIETRTDGKWWYLFDLSAKLNNNEYTVNVFKDASFFKEIVGKKIEKEEELLKMLEESNRDALTNLYLRSRSLELVEKGIYDASLGNYFFTIGSADIDFFKKVNDTYGHPFGDKVLAEIGKLFRENIRKIDFAGRLGGEEFILGYNTQNTYYSDAQFDILRKKIEDLEFETGDKNNPILQITMSFGVLNYEPTIKFDSINDPKLKEAALTAYEKADKALYRSKELGRNRVTNYKNM